jgi:hypothetical protein
MFTFLPKPYKSEVLREHRVRVVIVCLGLFIVAMLSGAILSIPTFIATRSQRNSVEQDKARLQAEVSSEKGEQVASEVRAIKAKLAILTAKSVRKPVVSVLERVLVLPRPGISIVGISLHRDAEKGIIVLQGSADTRADLVAFSKGLQGEPSFSRVDLPVSALAKGKDISFTIRMESAF